MPRTSTSGTRKWRTAVGGGYVNVDYNGTATNIILSRTAGAQAACGVVPSGAANLTAITLQQGNSCSPDYSFWEAYTRTQWNPVPQLDIGLQVMYTPQQHRVQRPGGAGGERLASRRHQRGLSYDQSCPAVFVMFRSAAQLLSMIA